jgi:hypothetical protein
LPLRHQSCDFMGAKAAADSRELTQRSRTNLTTSRGEGAQAPRRGVRRLFCLSARGQPSTSNGGTRNSADHWGPFRILSALACTIIPCREKANDCSFPRFLASSLSPWREPCYPQESRLSWRCSCCWLPHCTPRQSSDDGNGVASLISLRVSKLDGYEHRRPAAG